MNYVDQGLLREEPLLFIGLAALILWSSVWKGVALYRAGANHSPAWFVCLLIFNTLGILEILYLFVFGKKRTVVETPIYQAPAA